MQSKSRLFQTFGKKKMKTRLNAECDNADNPSSIAWKQDILEMSGEYGNRLNAYFVLEFSASDFIRRH